MLEIDKMQFSSAGRLKFEEAWLTFPNVHSIAQATWKKTAAGTPSKILAEKCSRTIKSLKRWSKLNAKSETEEARRLEGEIKLL